MDSVAPLVRSRLLPAFVVLVFLGSPAGALVVPPLGEAAAPAAGDEAGSKWTTPGPKGELADLEARGAWITSRYEVPLPAPDQVPGYARLDPRQRGAAWSAWESAVMTSDLFEEAAGSPWTMGAQGGAAPTGVPASRGLRGLWTLETHGRPRAVIPVSPPGATLLLTNMAILRFEAPDAKPAWMVKVGGAPGVYDTADANGDGSLDLIVGLHSFFSEDIPSPLVLDGKTGATLWTGPTGDDGVFAWTLTDLNGDRKPDLLGRNGRDQIVGYQLDGTKLFAEPLPLLNEAEQDLPAAWVAAYHFASRVPRWGDFNGDGVKDMAYLAGKAYFVASAASFDTYSHPLVAAVSGKDRSLLWAHSDPPSTSWAFASLGPVGDMDGDGNDDVIAYSPFFATVETPLPVFGYASSYGFSALSGTNGQPIFTDRNTGVDVFGPVPASQQVTNNNNYVPLAVLDLDKDGKTELVGRRVTEAGVEFTGRAPGAAPADGSTVKYRVEAAIGDHDVGPMRLRDLDGDGKLDILFITYSTISNNTGHSVLHTHIVRVVGTQAPTEETTNAFLGLLDYDPQGKRYYGWVLENDVWMAMDAEGYFSSEGLRLIPSSEVLASRDVTGDAIQDLLLPKSLGVAWVDGTNGRLLNDVLLPEDRFGETVVDEGGRLKALCNDLNDNTYLVDLETGKDEWSLRRDQFGEDTRAFLADLADVTGDGLSEILLRVYGKESDRTVVFDARKSTEIASETEATLDLFDGLPDRPGAEILREAEDEKEGDQLSLIVPKETQPRWTVKSDGAWVRMLEGGLLFFDNWGHAASRVVNGADGKDIWTYSAPKGEELEGLAAVKIDADATYDLALIVVKMPQQTFQGPLPAEARVWNGAKREITSTFELLPGYVEAEVTETSYRYSWGDTPWFVGDVGDWDGDGLHDLAFQENDTPIIRSGAKGGVLAAAPRHTHIEEQIDMDADGRKEFGLSSFTGELRLVTFDAAAAGEPPAPIVRAIDNPLEPKVSKGAEEFFLEAKKPKGTPGLEVAGIAVAAMVALAFASRRGERKVK